MQTSTLSGHKINKDGMLVVDVDVHIHELPSALAPYCEMPWRKIMGQNALRLLNLREPAR